MLEEIILNNSSTLSYLSMLCKLAKGKYYTCFPIDCSVAQMQIEKHHANAILGKKGSRIIKHFMPEILKINQCRQPRGMGR